MEKLSRDLIGADGLNAGLVFPFGVSKNFIVAHFAPLPGDQMTLDEDDIFSIDFGVHRNGRIVDSAFSMAFNPIYDPLLEVVKEATEVGIKTAGIDVLGRFQNSQNRKAIKILVFRLLSILFNVPCGMICVFKNLKSKRSW